MQLNIKSKFLGSMVGSALGDAIGELAFRYQDKESLSSQLKQLDKLYYTDDSTMSIGIAESIIKTGNLDGQDLGERFRRNFQKEPWRGYGPGPPTVFSKVERLGMSYVEAAKTLFGGKGSFGNGASMRVAPVGLFYHNSLHLYEKACISASVTHAHPVGKDGAAVQAKAVSLAVNLAPDEPFPYATFIKNLIDFAKTQELKEKLVMVQKLIMTSASPLRATRQLGQSVAVHESLPFATYSFLCHPQSFKECLFCAILHGGDRDTLGAMACALSGAYLGIDSIPQTWRKKLENRRYIEKLAVKLFDIQLQ